MKREKKMISEEERKKRRQGAIAIGLVLLVFFSFICLRLYFFAEKKTKSERYLEKMEAPILGSNLINDKEMRLAKIEDHLQAHKESIHVLIGKDAETKKEIKKLEKAQQKSAVDLTNRLTKAVENSFVSLRKELSSHFSKRESEEEVAPVLIRSANIPLPHKKKHVSSIIPAGTVLPCVIISGADCSAGIANLSDPEMILLRPLEKGKLPRGVLVNIQDSIIIARAVGNLSKERVRIRAERMTMVKPNGEFVSTTFSGYVTGEDGREGVRGVVVDRSGKMITRASFASFFQGIANGFQVAKNQQTLAKVGRLTGKTEAPFVLSSDVLKESATRGVGTGMQKLAEYWIKRAEQLQPSIQVAAGRRVDLVFTCDVTIGEKDIKQVLQTKRALAKKQREKAK